MKVLITGGSGLIGRALLKILSAKGYDCLVLSRRPELFRHKAGFKNFTWLSYDDPLPEVEAVIHLAGESVAALWTEKKKEKIIRSRVENTRWLIQKLAQQKNPPRIFLGASAVGWYGNRPNEILTEGSAPDPERKFRWQVCEAWERATEEAGQLGARVVTLRIGNILDPDGGYLQALLWPWRFGLGIGLGARESKLSWIALSDAIRLIAFALECEELRGPVNITSPYPVSQFELMAAMKRQLKPFLTMRIPVWILKVAMGEFSQAVTGSQEIFPAKALRAEFVFEDSRLTDLFAKFFSHNCGEADLKPR